MDASNELSDTCRRAELAAEDLDANPASEPAGWSDTGSGPKLEVRLEETTVILRMALNNEFVRALEICGRR